MKNIDKVAGYIRKEADFNTYEYLRAPESGEAKILQKECKEAMNKLREVSNILLMSDFFNTNNPITSEIEKANKILVNIYHLCQKS